MAIAVTLLSAGTSSGSSATTAGATSTSGARFAVCIAWDAGQTISTVSDSKGNTYSAVGTAQADGNGGLLQWYFSAGGSSGASHTATVSFSGSAFPSISHYEITDGASSAHSGSAQGQDSGGQPFTLTSGTMPSGNWAALAGCSNNTGSDGAYSANGSTPTFTLLHSEGTVSSYWTHGVSSTTSSGTGAVTPSFNRSGTAGGTTGMAILVIEESAGGPAPTVDQAGARFGADDGSESAHTWLAAQGADLTRALGSSFLYRALLQWDGDGSAITPVLRAQKNGSGGYVALPVGASVTPTLSYGAAGAFAYSGTNPAAAYPTGITADSELVLFVGQKPSSANGGTVTTPTGWTLQGSLTGANDGNTGGYSTTLAADTGNCNIYVYTKDTVSGSESGSLTVTTGTNNVAWARIIRLQKSIPGTVTWAVGTGKDTSAGSVSIATGAMDIAAGDYILAGMVIPTDVTTPSQFSAHALSQSGTTFGTVTEIGEADSTTGNDIGGYLIQAPVSSGSGSGAVTMTATAGGTTTNVRGPGIVLRARPVTVNNELYIATSANITAGGEDTTSRLSGGTGTFLTGRRWDDENGSDALGDPSADQNTEVEWSLNTQSPATDGDYWDFRVYDGSSALDTYTDEIRLTIGTASSPSLPLPQSLLQRIPALLRF